jgi:hypothetical protein
MNRSSYFVPAVAYADPEERRVVSTDAAVIRMGFEFS